MVVGAGLLLASWAAIGFDGLTGYPDLLRRLNDAVGDDAYTGLNLARDLGAPFTVAHVLWLALAIGLLAGCLVVSRTGDERSAFVLALAASLALSPLVWLHYFALLIVAVAVSRPRLGLVWFVPLGLVLTPGVGDPTPTQTAVALTVVGATFALALREVRTNVRGVETSSSSPPPNERIGCLPRRRRTDSRVPRGCVRSSSANAPGPSVVGLAYGSSGGGRCSSSCGNQLSEGSGSAATTSGTWCRRYGARLYGHPLETTNGVDGRADDFRPREPCRSHPRRC